MTGPSLPAKARQDGQGTTQVWSPPLHPRTS